MGALEEAWTLFTEDRYAEAEQAFRQLIQDEFWSEAECDQARFGLGYALAFSDQFSEARELYLQLRHKASCQGDGGAEHRALHQLGMVERMAGDWLAAQHCFEEEAQLIQALGAPDLSVAINAYEQGWVALHLNQMERSRLWLGRSLEHARKTADHVAVGCALRGLGDWEQRQGDERQAAKYWMAALQVFEAIGNVQGVSGLQLRLFPP